MKRMILVALLAAIGFSNPPTALAEEAWTPRTFDCGTLDVKAPPDGRLALDGFSILAPKGPNWCAFAVTRQLAYFGALSFLGVRLEHRPSQTELVHTFEAHAARVVVTERRIDTQAELLTFVHEMARNGLGMDPASSQVLTTTHFDPRFKMLKSIIAAEKFQGADCVRFSGVEQETGNRESPTGVFTMEIPDGLICLIPGTPGGLVLIGYSERYPNNQDPRPRLAESLKPQLAVFMQSLRFGSTQ